MNYILDATFEVLVSNYKIILYFRILVYSAWFMSLVLTHYTIYLFLSSTIDYT